MKKKWNCTGGVLLCTKPNSADYEIILILCNGTNVSAFGCDFLVTK